jgi:hypothetical protein
MKIDKIHVHCTMYMGFFEDGKWGMREGEGGSGGE